MADVGTNSKPSPQLSPITTLEVDAGASELQRVASHSNGHTKDVPSSFNVLKPKSTEIYRDDNQTPLTSPDEGKGCSKMFLQMTDKPTEQDIQDNALYANHCNANNIPYQAMSTREEIWGWYMYDWANSPMWQIALGLVFPTYLALLSTQYACEHNVPYSCDYYDKPINSNKTLWVVMGSWSLKPSSYAAAMLSISSLLQAFAYITIGGLADYKTYQHYLFRICALLGASMLLVWWFFDKPDTWLIAGWWGAINVIFFGLSLVFYNAYLAPIVTNHWRVRRAVQKGDGHLQISKLEQSVTDEMSQYGFACGYCGSFVLTIVVVLVFVFLSDWNVEISKMYGTKSSTIKNLGSSYVVDKYKEEWAKPVIGCTFHYALFGLNDSDSDSNTITQVPYIGGIQFDYDDIGISGDFYGINSTINSVEKYSIPSDNDYIEFVEIWYLDNSIYEISPIIGMQFTTESGIKSPIFGNNNGTSMNKNNSVEYSIESSRAKSTWEEGFVIGGYTVNTANDIIISMSFVFMNGKEGQYGTTLPHRLSMVIVSIWWLSFQIYAFKHLQKRPKQEIPESDAVWNVSIKEFFHTVQSATQYPHMFRYLISFFMFSDGINTIASVGILFGQTELGMTGTELVFILLESEIFAAMGNVLFIWIQKKMRWNAKQMLMMHLASYIFLPFYALIGLIKNIEFGLVNKWELYVFTAWFALHLGSVQSYSRTLMTYLIPVGYENQMFALYEITDKGSSWIGPLMVAIVNNFASMRWAVFYVVWLFILPMPILWFGVDMKKGMKQAGKYRMRKRNDPNWARISMTLSNTLNSSIQKDIEQMQSRLSISIENANLSEKDKEFDDFDRQTIDNTHANSQRNKVVDDTNYLSVNTGNNDTNSSNNNNNNNKNNKNNNILINNQSEDENDDGNSGLKNINNHLVAQVLSDSEAETPSPGMSPSPTSKEEQEEDNGDGQTKSFETEKEKEKENNQA